MSGDTMTAVRGAHPHTPTSGSTAPKENGHNCPVSPPPNFTSPPRPPEDCSDSDTPLSSASEHTQTWVQFAKTFVVIFPIYALGYFEFSFSWLLIGIVLFFCWRRNAGGKSGRLNRALAFLAHEDLPRHTLTSSDLPPWVHFPDVERVEWVNKTVCQMWPYVCQFVEKLFRQTIEPAVRQTHGQLSSFCFTTINLGDKPLRVNGVKVYSENVDKHQIIMDLQVSFVGNTEVDVEVKRYFCRAGIKSIQLHGVLRVLMDPLLGDMPLVGALSLFFLKKPLLDITWTGLTNILDIPGLSGFSESIIQDIIYSYLVLPNRITIPLVGDVELTQLRYPMPKGVLRIHFLEAQDLEGKDQFLGGLIKAKSDPYGLLQIGTQHFRSRTIKANLHPKWNQVFEALVYEFTGQYLEIELFDEDTDKDDFLGSLMMDLSQLHQEQKVDEWFDLEEAPTGKLHLKLEWLSLLSNPDKMDQVLRSVRADRSLANDGLSSALLMVYLDSAKNLPSSLSDYSHDGGAKQVSVFKTLKCGKKGSSEPSPFVRFSVGTKTLESKVRFKTREPMWEEAFSFLVHNPRRQELELEVKDDKHKCTMGNLTVPLRDLLEEQDMTRTQSFSLRNSAPSACITLRLALRVLSLEKQDSWDQPSSVQVRKTSVPQAAPPGPSSSSTLSDSPQTAPSPPPPAPSSAPRRAPTSSRSALTLRPRDGEPYSLSPARSVSALSCSPACGSQQRLALTESSQSLASDASLPGAHLELHNRLRLLHNGSLSPEPCPLGEVQLTLRHSSQRNKLIVVVHACRHLLAFSRDSADPFLRLYLLPDRSRAGRRKTPVMKRTLDPVYDQTFEFSVSMVELHRRSLDVAVKNGGRVLTKHKGLLGKVLVDLSGEDISKGWTQWVVMALFYPSNVPTVLFLISFVIYPGRFCGHGNGVRTADARGAIMSKREGFLDSVSTEKVEDFLRFIHLHKDETEPFDVEEVLQELPQDRREALWSRLLVLLQRVLLDRPPEGWESGPGQEPGPEAVEGPVDLKQTIAVVEGVALVATVTLNVLQDGDPYDSLLECSRQLHDLLAVLPDSAASLQQQIRRLCELWWKKGLLGKDQFGRTAFLLSLQRSLSLKKPGAEIQRLLALREVLLGLDFTPEDNERTVQLLLECFLKMTFVRSDDGKRFLVFLFSWNVDFIWMIHGTIKNQLEFYTRALTDHLAEIYFRAWKKATGDFLEKMESVCIQDLMQHAILLHRTSPVHGNVRQIMSYFHKRKGCQRVDRMLFELYKPILWRALSAPNHEVRANATLMFTEAFALHDPAQSSQAIDASIQKQLDTLMGLLDDPHPLVRSAAILGVCRILTSCWELLPPSVITDFLKKLVVELAADCSCADVRCSVFKCLSMVLDNPLSHPLLEKLLPVLKNSLHDTSEKVRCTFLDMLLKVKAVRAAKFWDVCNMDHLLARLALDSQPVSKRIVDLLFKSFFPVNESENEWCCRCITLIQMNPRAARKFYQNAYLHVAPTNIVKLMLSIRRVLNTCLPSQADMSQAELSQLSDGNKENKKLWYSQMENMLSAQGPGLVASLLEVLVILWTSVQKALDHNKEAQQYTVAKFSSVMSMYFKTFEDERSTVSLVFLASMMPPSAVPTFSCGVLSKLRRMDAGASQTEFGQLIDCLCGWGQAADVLDLISQWLAESLPRPAGKAKPGRKVRIQDTAEAKPDLGLSYLEYLFSRSSTRDHVLPLAQSSLRPLHKILGAWSSVLYSSLSSGEVDRLDARVQTALRAFTLQARLAVHLHNTTSPESRDFLWSLELSMAWLEERVLPYLSTPKPGSVPGEGQAHGGATGTLDLAKDIVEGFVTVCRDVLLVGLGDKEFKDQILRLCSLILLSEKGYLCIPLVLSVLKEVTENSMPEDDREENPQEENPQEENPQEENPQEENQGPTGLLLGLVTNIFQKLVERLAWVLRKKPEEGRELCVSASPNLGDFLQVVHDWGALPSSPLQGVFSTLFAGIIVEIRHPLQKVSQQEELVVPESVEDLPPLSNILLSVILKNPAVTRLFLAEVSTSVDSEAIDCVTGLAASLHILNVVAHAGQVGAAVKSAAMCVQRQLQKIPAGHDGDSQRLIYDSSIKTLNKVLHF
ncbi:unnamed protein product [Lota lota]